MRTILLRLARLSLLAVGFSTTAPAKENVFADERDTVAGNALSAEQKAVLSAVDVRLLAVETISAKIDDPDYKAEVARQIEDLKKRRLEIERSFDQASYEALMHSVISRYQVTALWLKPPRLPPLHLAPVMRSP